MNHASGEATKHLNPKNIVIKEVRKKMNWKKAIQKLKNNGAKAYATGLLAATMALAPNIDANAQQAQQTPQNTPQTTQLPFSIGYTQQDTTQTSLENLCNKLCQENITKQDTLQLRDPTILANKGASREVIVPIEIRGDHRSKAYVDDGMFTFPEGALIQLTGKEGLVTTTSDYNVETYQMPQGAQIVNTEEGTFLDTRNVDPTDRTQSYNLAIRTKDKQEAVRVIGGRDRENIIDMYERSKRETDELTDIVAQQDEDLDAAISEKRSLRINLNMHRNKIVELRTDLQEAKETIDSWNVSFMPGVTYNAKGAAPAMKLFANTPSGFGAYFKGSTNQSGDIQEFVNEERTQIPSERPITGENVLSTTGETKTTYNSLTAGLNVPVYGNFSASAGAGANFGSKTTTAIDASWQERQGEIYLYNEEEKESTNRFVEPRGEVGILYKHPSRLFNVYGTVGSDMQGRVDGSAGVGLNLTKVFGGNK